jgi:LacI family transcriptional regulator
MVTMADVARRARVSVSTVSHVMNDTRPVAEATLVPVLRAIQEIGYTPNRVARSLATASTRLIGLAISAISNPYFTNLVHAIEAELPESGYMPPLADPHEDPARKAATAAERIELTKAWERGNRDAAANARERFR